MNTQVLIVGAGPVGLTLAIDLGRRGVRCMVLEKKKAPEFLPKMARCNARTMEIYRLCVPKTLSVLISRRNRLTSAHHDRAAMFRIGRLGRTIQVKDPA